jgi:thiol-disulfide isomerase/thioredoxin
MLPRLTVIVLATGSLPGQGSAPTLPRIGGTAPAFTFSEVVSPAGPAAPKVAELTPDRLRGKVVVLDFFATWCAPCVASIPHTNTLVNEMRDRPVVFLAIADEPREALETVLARSPMRAILVRDAGGLTFRNYFIAGLPFVVVVDATGKIAAFTHPDELSRDLIETVIGRGDERLTAPLASGFGHKALRLAPLQ